VADATRKNTDARARVGAAHSSVEASAMGVGRRGRVIRLTDKHRQLVAVLGLIQIDAHVGGWSGGVGRPALHGRAIARAFVAKAIYNLSDTRQLLDRLQNDVSLQCICGWSRQSETLHESQFSRAFASFAASKLPQRLHEGLIEAT